MLKYFLAAVAPSPSHHRAPSKDDDGTPDQGPDVVLMDISMPGTDGIEAHRRHRPHQRCALGTRPPRLIVLA